MNIVEGMSAPAIGQAGATGRGHGRTPAAGGEMQPTTTGRALVALGASAQAEPPAGTRRRPVATFLAHLIATHRELPQTRERRRAEPEEAIAAYGVAARLIPIK